jgi:hypothetical protein
MNLIGLLMLMILHILAGGLLSILICEALTNPEHDKEICLICRVKRLLGIKT